MARLILNLDGHTLAEYNMTKERYTVGRLPDNDVRIDNPAVSGHHSLIINILNDSFIEDLNSTNGTYVNGKLIKKHALQHGDKVTIGHHQIRFVDQQAEEDEQDDFEKTMVINPRSQDEEAMEQARRAVDDETPANGSAVGNGELVTARLQVLTGEFSGREVNLTKSLTTLGRPDSHVVAITRRPNGYYIVRVSGKTSADEPQVNGMSLGATALLLQDSDVLELSGIKLGFFAGNESAA
ncbi:MAG: FHA domain-containing protein [Gammaproteobacteria bacterium]